jgi:hypothetical protein
MVFVAMLVLSAPAFVQDRSEKYEGRRLADALQALQARGLRIVFSTEIVTPGMRVVAEPHAKVEREMLDELLAPHGLKAEGGPGVVILVVRAKPAGAVDSRKQPDGIRTGAIRGQVVDAAAHSPLSGILVLIIGTERSARTDQEGRFQLRDVPAGTQTLSVSVAGYAFLRRTVRVTGGRTLAVTIALAQDAGTLRRF